MIKCPTKLLGILWARPKPKHLNQPSFARRCIPWSIYKNIYCYEFGVRPTYFFHRSKLKQTLLKFIYFYKVVSFLNSIFHITNLSNLRVLKKNKGRKTGHKASTKSGLKILQNKFTNVFYGETDLSFWEWI